MKAGDVKCPKCGTGFRDVAPDYTLGADDDSIVVTNRSETYGHCHGSHRLIISWTRCGEWGQPEFRIYAEDLVRL